MAHAIPGSAGFLLPQHRPSEQAAEGSGLLSKLQLSLRTECAYPPSKQAPKWNRRPAGYLRTSPGSRGSVFAHLPTSIRHSSAPNFPPPASLPTSPRPPIISAPSPIPTALRPLAQGWPAARRPTLGSLPNKLPTPRGLRPRHHIPDISPQPRPKGKTVD
jgi:hypothetical protein